MVNTSETATNQEGLLCVDQDVTTISAQRFEELLKAEIQLKTTLRVIAKVPSYNLASTLDLLFGTDEPDKKPEDLPEPTDDEF
jgi:hypothetical protein